MRYCTHCLYPETKPDIWFDEKGKCAACIAFDTRKDIDWNVREKEFIDMVEHIKLNRRTYYDCVIPVSGGKDSHFQVIMALKYGLRPLCVTATTDYLSDLGRRNLDNLQRLGVDCVEVSTAAPLRRKINNYTLRTIGDISWAEHITIFTIPVREALIRGIPLILWGENPQNEYGGPEEHFSVKVLDKAWLQEFGGLNGLRVTDLIDKGIAKKEELYQYTYPNNLEYGDVRGLFLGYYFQWDGFKNAEVAKQYGFEYAKKPVETCGYKYENLDNYQTGIHDFFKYIKFGFGRATDIVCNHIRRRRMSRAQGIRHIQKWDGKYPRTYLEKPIEEILAPIKMTKGEFDATVMRFVNKKLFRVETGSDQDTFNIVPLFEVGKND